jgi:hypothetical protein
MTERDRIPYPFFCSIEFWTVVVKTLGTLSFAVPAMTKSGFSIESAFILLGAIANGFLLSAKELEIHQNLYTNEGIAGRNKSDAIANIAYGVATDIASKDPAQTVASVLREKATDELVNFATNKAGLPSIKNILKRIF